jgi:hypothetical protein
VSLCLLVGGSWDGQRLNVPDFRTYIQRPKLGEVSWRAFEENAPVVGELENYRQMLLSGVRVFGAVDLNPVEATRRLVDSYAPCSVDLLTTMQALDPIARQYFGPAVAADFLNHAYRALREVHAKANAADDPAVVRADGGAVG